MKQKRLKIKKMRKGTRATLLLIGCMFLMLILPHALRYVGGNHYLIGGESYEGMYIASVVIQSPLSIDELSYDKLMIQPTPYHFVLAVLSQFISLEILARVLPIVLGVLTMIVLYSFVLRVGMGRDIAFVAALLFILSPITVSAFSRSSSLSMVSFLVVCGFWLLLCESAFVRALAFVLFYIAGYFHVLHSVCIIALLFAFAYYYRNRVVAVSFSVLAIVVGTVSCAILFVQRAGALHNDGLSFASRMISAFGGGMGLGVFTIILAIVGIALSFGKKQRFYPLYVTWILVLIVSYFGGSEFNIYTQFLTIGFGAYALMYLIARRWEVAVLKMTTVTVIFCGLLFSSLAAVQSITMDSPNEDIANSLLWLRENSDVEAVVLSNAEYAPYIKYFGNATPFATRERSDEIARKRVAESFEIMMSRNMYNTTSELDRNGITNIFITSRMRDGGVWNKDKEGMLFLLRNNQTFMLLYEGRESEVWKYVPMNSS